MLRGSSLLLVASLLDTSTMVPVSSKKKKESIDKDILVRKRHWKAKSRKWSEWEVLLRRSQVEQESTNAVRRRGSPRRNKLAHTSLSSPTASFTLPLGGTFNVYPDLLSSQQQQDLSNELLEENSHRFRQYRIQGNPEPRAHFLLHERATNDFDSSTQPGYKYGNITMKATPLSMLPTLEGVAQDMLEKCGEKSWNIGVDAVYYRGSRDKIGLHADNNQGEDKVVAILAKSPRIPRPVVIQTAPPKGTKKNQDGDEQYELIIGAGDAYDMDGVIQQHYLHGVPPGEDGRLAVVLRHGTFRKYTKDSGEALPNLNPRAVIPKTFGRMKSLKEGKSYSRQKLLELGAHK